MTKISLSDFVREVAKHTGFSQKNIKEVIESMDSIAMTHLKNGDAVRIMPSITVDTYERAARNSRNPSKNEPIYVPAKTFLRAKFSASAKEAVL